jgi:RHS repeat-associated protein
VTSTKTSRADASPPVFGLPLATIRSPLLSNALRSLSGVTQEAGGQFTDQLYYPWGQFWTYQVLKYGPQFAGMERVEPYASDTYPTPNRIYSGNYGRWLSPDPLGGDVSNPQSLNRYAYVMNNPTSFVDPLGLFRCWNSGTGTYCGAETGVTGLDSGGWGGEGDRAADPLLVYAPTITHNGAGTGHITVVTKPGNSFPDKIFGQSLRLPGETVGACVQRVGNTVFGEKLNAFMSLTSVTGLVTLPTFGAQIYPYQVIPGVTYKGSLLEISALMGRGTALRGAQIGTQAVSKILGPLTAVSTGIQLGIAVDCR